MCIRDSINAEYGGRSHRHDGAFGAGSQLVMSSSQSPVQGNTVEDAHALFAFADYDDQGYLTHAELKGLFKTNPDLRARMNAWKWKPFLERILPYGEEGVNEQGFVEYYLRHGLTEQDVEARDQRLREVFKLMDADSDGSLTRLEVVKALRKHQAVRDVMGLAAVKQNDVTHNAFEAKFQELDENEDKVISYEEFVVLAKDLEGLRPADSTSGHNAWWNQKAQTPAPEVAPRMEALASTPRRPPPPRNDVGVLPEIPSKTDDADDEQAAAAADQLFHRPPPPGPSDANTPSYGVAWDPKDDPDERSSTEDEGNPLIPRPAPPEGGRRAGFRDVLNVLGAFSPRSKPQPQQEPLSYSSDEYPSAEVLHDQAMVHIRLGHSLERRKEHSPEALEEYRAGVLLLEQALDLATTEEVAEVVHKELLTARKYVSNLEVTTVIPQKRPGRDGTELDLLGVAEWNLIDPDSASNPPIVDHCIAQVAPAAEVLGTFFGFQEESIRNQSEHLVMLLIARMTAEEQGLTNAIAFVHNALLKNQRRWCKYVRVTPPTFGEGGMLWELMLWMLIWGEAGNLRHMPECLCWLFYKMCDEAVDAGITINSNPTRPDWATRNEGHFLVHVVKPLYLSVVQGAKSKVKKNYDDCNEAFWTRRVLQYAYDNSMTELEHITVALLQGELSGKTFVEQRSILSTFLCSWRLHKFQAVLGCTLVVRAYYARSDRIAEWELGEILWRSMCTAVAFDMMQCILMLMGGAMKFCDTAAVLYAPRVVLCFLMSIAASYLSIAHHEPADSARSDKLNAIDLGMFAAVMLFELIQFGWETFEIVIPRAGKMLRVAINRNEASSRLCAVLLPHTSLGYLGNLTLQYSWTRSIRGLFFWFAIFWCKSVFTFSFLILDVMDASVELIDAQAYPLIEAYPEFNGGVGGEYATIAVAWAPLTLMWFLDAQIWFQIFVATVGCVTGWIARIGEVRSFNHMAQTFHKLPEHATRAFGVGACFKDASDAREEVYKLGFLDRVSWRPSPTQCQTIHTDKNENGENGHGHSHDHDNPDPEQHPHGTIENEAELAHGHSHQHGSRHEHDADSGNEWAVLGPIWNMAVEGIRAHDLISNRELECLKFRPRPPPSNTPGLPLFLLAGEITRANDYALSYLEPAALGEYQTKGEMWGQYRKKWQYMLEAVGEVSDIVFSLTRALLGSRHDEITLDIRKWMLEIDFDSFESLAHNHLQAFTDSLVSFADNIIDASEKFHNLPQTATGQAMLAKNDAAIKRDAIEQTVDQETGETVRVFKAQRLTSLGKLCAQLVASLRVVLLRGKAVCAGVPMIEEKIHKLMFTADGWFWDEQYCERQVVLVVADPNLVLYAKSLKLLMTTAKLDTTPANSVARDQLAFFANSLLMNIPVPPAVGAMRSWSVLTPYYSEDVIYSDKELDSLTDDEVTMLFYLQMLLPDEWNNFLERHGVESEDELKKTDKGRFQRRIWASYRGQTLSRTVRGMMCAEEAVAALAKFCDGAAAPDAARLASMKFSYVVSCQIYGQQAKTQDSKCAQINVLMKQYRNLRVAFIDERRVGGRTQSTEYFSVLVKAKMDEDGNDRIVEVFRVKLPGMPIIGEGKPENQNHAMIFTRGEYLQTIDMNQDWNFHECLKMRNLLQEFSKDREEGMAPPVIAGFRENIFTIGLSSIGTFMALQDTSFVTINQRMLYTLDVRMHYGHPDVFDKLFTMSSGGVSKASKGVNLSEDIFAGFNATLRGGRVTYSDYIAVGKGRDTGLGQIYKFEAKVAQGNAEQSTSRDYYRLGNSFSLTRLASLYFGHLGYYIAITGMLVTIFVFLYANVILSLTTVDPCSADDPKLTESACGALVQVLNAIWLLQVGVANTLPLLATRGLQLGWRAAIWEFVKMHLEGGPFYFLFQIQTRAHYFSQTLLYGGAKYRATGRGFLIRHEHFDDLYRFYYSSHFQPAMELLFLALMWYIHVDWSVRGPFILSSWTIWILILAWTFSPFFFNPLGFEWEKTKVDLRRWWSWMRRQSLSADTSFSVWWIEEESVRIHAKGWVRIGGMILASRHLLLALAFILNVKNDAWRIPRWPLVLIAWTFCMVIWWSWVYIDRFLERTCTLRALRGIKAFLLFVLAPAVLVLAYFWPGQKELTFPDVLRLIFAVILFHAAICSILAAAGWPAAVRSKFVTYSAKAYHYMVGVILFTPIVVLSLIPHASELQTFIMFNAAYGRGLEVAALLQGRRKLKTSQSA
eukprot:TRINITY_DN755_c0_g2_i12.p1 TRINITY_DN755_c0_g2~~TRINITY_DN755_c0_g2_i12.p1  ORF type:complete len:2229 (+),score=428.66 TRINITY_DN755_c0_g2_i12:164-6850(+)